MFCKDILQKFPGNLKRATAQAPCRKRSAMESFFNEIAGMNSIPATSLKKAFTKDVYLWIYYNFQSFHRKNLHELSFFDKIQGCVLQGCSFIKTLVHCRLFSQIFFSNFIFCKQLVFGIFSKRICGEFHLRQSCSLKTVGL